MEFPERIYSLLGHALLADVDFRRWLCEDPTAAAASIGITLTDVEASYIKGNISRSRLHGIARSVAHFNPYRGHSAWHEPV